MKKIFKSIVCAVLVAMMLATNVLLVACKDNKTYYNNEEDALIFASQDVDRLFNPFFSTTAPDGNVVGLTQIGMLTNNSKGEPAYGANEAVIALDMEEKTEGTGKNETTTYMFVLKNNVRFSNGSYLTIKDVLFNLYVYLDPVYDGSSTIYSTDIVGLKAYRTQTRNEAEQKKFEERFDVEANTRVSTLISAYDTITRANSLAKEDIDLLLEKLTEYQANGDAYANLVKDYNNLSQLFKEELQQDYNAAKDTYQDVVFTDKNNKVHKNLLTTDVEAFLLNESLIEWNKNDAELRSPLDDFANLKNYTEAQAIDVAYEYYMTQFFELVLTGTASAINLRTDIANQAKSDYFKTQANLVPNIEGIKFANRTEPCEVNGKTYDVPKYSDSNKNQVTEGNEVLTITINGVDPKAIWNFSFAVAPMYYYSDAEHIAAFDYESNFGVERSDPDFMKNVVKNEAKISVPVGAGPYAASKSSGGIENIKAGEFYDKGVIYFERNPYYVGGLPVIKKIRYQVISASQQLNSLTSKDIDFAEPNAKPETISDLGSLKDKGIGYKNVTTLGYGYIGINATKVQDIKVRQAIMHAINTQECVDYYKSTAKAIYRSMSKENWAYPEDCTPYYPYIGDPIPENFDSIDPIDRLPAVNPDYTAYVKSLGLGAGDRMTEKQQQDFIRKLVTDAGYTLNGENIYQNGKRICKYEFAIAGQETDHPAYNALLHASEILNKCGFRITVKPRNDALSQLASGGLTVWAAAWGSTIDPDMYQVYHKDSSATAILNWGYSQIKQNKEEASMLTDLSKLIDEARHTTDQDRREILYHQCLNIVMRLAIELPTYQRDDLFAYNSNKIDISTFNQTVTSYKGLTSDLHTVSLVVKER